VAAALGLGSGALADGLPIQQISCGAPFLFVPLRDRTAVDDAMSDAAAFRRLAAATGIDLGIYLFAFQGAGAPETVYSRMFAPVLGIVEDPATGSASGPVGCYLVEHGLLRGNDAQHIVCRQGVRMGRASTIHAAIAGGPGAITSVRVGGEAVLVGDGAIVV
jgi:trans-2,3-dihydro-3-hydroxyanthranilate isomerase